MTRGVYFILFWLLFMSGPDLLRHCALRVERLCCRGAAAAAGGRRGGLLPRPVGLGVGEGPALVCGLCLKLPRVAHVLPLQVLQACMRG